MDKFSEVKHHQMEMEYWWFRARRDMILKLLQEEDKTKKILDIGCAGGHLIKTLQEKGFNNVWGIDLSKEAVAMCKQRGIQTVVVGDGAEPPFTEQDIEVVISSDILEHIENDEQALQEWHRILKKNGKMILFVPAFMFLWSRHDLAAHHHRRYGKKELLDKIKKAGFNIKRVSFWNFFLFPPVTVLRSLQRLRGNKTPKDQLLNLSSWSNKMFLGLLKFENKILQRTNFPIGVSLMVIAEKTDQEA